MLGPRKPRRPAARGSLQIAADPVFHGLAELAPNLFNAVPKCTTKRRIDDIKGARTVPVLVEYLQLWDLVDGIVLQQ
jgi:hypothetical protein